MPISVTLNLNQTDKVDIWLVSGSISDERSSHYAVFTGFLLEQDLSL